MKRINEIDLIVQIQWNKYQKIDKKIRAIHWYSICIPESEKKTVIHWIIDQSEKQRWNFSEIWKKIRVCHEGYELMFEPRSWE